MKSLLCSLLMASLFSVQIVYSEPPQYFIPTGDGNIYIYPSERADILGTFKSGDKFIIEPGPDSRLWSKLLTESGALIGWVYDVGSSESLAPKQEEETSMQTIGDESVSLVYSLVNDAVDLLPANLRQKILEADNLDPIMEGASSFEPSIRLKSYSVDPNNFGVQAAYILRGIYGERDFKKKIIPQTLYFNGFSKIDIDNIEDRIKKDKSQLVKTETLYRDQYNLALNLLVNIWLNDFKKSGETISKIPKEGVYLRDSNGNLYFYEGGRR